MKKYRKELRLPRLANVHSSRFVDVFVEDLVHIFLSTFVKLLHLIYPTGHEPLVFIHLQRSSIIGYAFCRVFKIFKRKY
jgi:hypothetical protein